MIRAQEHRLAMSHLLVIFLILHGNLRWRGVPGPARRDDVLVFDRVAVTLREALGFFAPGAAVRLVAEELAARPGP